MKKFFTLLLIFAACSPKVQPPYPEASKPSWLKSSPSQEGYYIGIGHSQKSNNHNYIQAAKKSALDDLVSEIKVNISSTSVLSQFEVDKKLSEQYEQIIQTTVADEIEEFEMVDAWEDDSNYWVYYRLSIARYREIKEEQKRNASILSTDYLLKGKQAEKQGAQLQALQFYFQALRSIEKYLGEVIRVTIENNEHLLVNEIYASIQQLLDKIVVRVEPNEIALNRRVNQSSHTVIAKVNYKNTKTVAVDVPLLANFEKGAGDVFQTYKTNAQGLAKILINKINSKDLEQIVKIKVDIDALSSSGNSPIYTLVAKTLNVPHAQVALKVQRPVVYVTSAEKSLGSSKASLQIMNKLKNLLANNGFEFTDNKLMSDLWFDITADSEKGSISGSIYVTYLTSVIKVIATKEGKEIYATTLDRIKGYGLDYDKSSVDAYSKALETLEKERVSELLNTVLQ